MVVLSTVVLLEILIGFILMSVVGNRLLRDDKAHLGELKCSIMRSYVGCVRCLEQPAPGSPKPTSLSGVLSLCKMVEWRLLSTHTLGIICDPGDGEWDQLYTRWLIIIARTTKTELTVVKGKLLIPAFEGQNPWWMMTDAERSGTGSFVGQILHKFTKIMIVPWWSNHLWRHKCHNLKRGRLKPYFVTGILYLLSALWCLLFSSIKLAAPR